LKSERPDFRIIPVRLPDAREHEWSELFGKGQNPPFNWVSFSSTADDEAMGKLTEAVTGNFTTKASGPEAVTPYYIRRQAALWDKSGRADNSYLIGGKLLKEAQAQDAANPTYVSVNSVPAYLVRCAQSERNWLRMWLGLSIGALAVTGGLGFETFLQRNEAVRQKDEALQNARVSQARSLTSLAVKSIGEDRADERALLLARQGYLLDERTGGQSSYLVGSSLAEVLATPYLSSVFQLPGDHAADQISPSGAYIISGDTKPVLTGPVITREGKMAHPISIEVGAPFAMFLPNSDELLVAADNGNIELRSVFAPAGAGTLLCSLGAVPKLLSISADGSRAIAAVGDSELVLIDIRAGKRLDARKLREKVRVLAISADGKFVAVLEREGGKLRVYAEKGESAVAVYPGQDDVTAFDFIGTTTVLVVGERSGEVWVWEPKKGGGPRRRLDPGDPRGSVNSVAVSADGAIIATASGSIAPGISLWKSSSPSPSAGFIPGPRNVAKLAFSANSQFLVSSLFSGEMRYWRMDGAGTRRAVLAREKQPLPLPGRLYAVVREPSSDHFIVGGDHGVLQIWPSSSLEGEPQILATKRAAVLAQVPDQDRFMNGGRNFLTTGHVMAIGHARNGSRFATVDPYGFAVIWRSDDLNMPAALIPSPSVNNAAFSVALSPSGRKVAVGATSTITFVYELDVAGEPIRNLQLASEGDYTVRSLVFLDETHLLVGDDSGRLSLWSLNDTPSAVVLIDSGPAITALALLPHDRVVVGRGDQVDFVNLSAAPTPVQTVTKGLGDVYSIAVSDDLKSLAVGFGDGAVRIWSLAEPDRLPMLLTLHRDIVRSLTFDRSGEVIVSVGDDGMIRSSIVGRNMLARLACDVIWRELDPNEKREFFGVVTPPILPTCGTSAVP
jgi:WD40 repeat protein